MRKSTDENDHSQTGQGEEIGTSPAQHTSPRRGRTEDFTEMNPSNTGHGRQNPSVNSKKKPDSEDKEEDEEEEDEEVDEEEEEIATALDSKEVSHVHVNMDACDHSKQRLESEIAPETPNDSESEVTDGCDPSKKALDKTEVSHKNFDTDANDQSEQGPEPEIGTENQHGPESEDTEGGDTSTNKPGDNIGTKVISPGEGGSDDNSDGPTVLQYNLPLSGKALLYQQYLESKQNVTIMNVPGDNVVIDVISPGGGGSHDKLILHYVGKHYYINNI